MDYVISIATKIVFVLLLMFSGVLAKRLRLLSDQGEKDLSILVMDMLWPALIFHSITTTLTSGEILANIWMPILSVLVHVVGFVLGLIVCRLSGYRDNRRRVFMFHATMNNFFLMSLPFAQAFFPQRGTALLAVANLGSIITLWTLGLSIMVGNPGFGKTVKNLCSPGLVATLLGIVFVFTGANRYVPGVLNDFLLALGQPNMMFGMMIAGTQIYKLGFKALKFDAWNLQVGLVRNILVPGLMLCLALLLRGHLSRETLVMFMLVSATPASVNSVSIALKYDRAPDLAAEGVIFTHLLAVFTMVCFISLTDWLV